jgi:hypothetical protein
MAHGGGAAEDARHAVPSSGIVTVMGTWDLRRDKWATEVATARKRARFTIAALALTAGLAAYMSLVSVWQIGLLDDAARGVRSQPMLELSDTMFELGSLAQLVVLLATGVGFLMWLAKTVAATRAMTTIALGWTPSQAVWGFFIPFVNFVRPYRVVRDVHDRLDPEGVPEPAPRPRPDKAADYRNVPIERAPLPAPLPHASIRLWWGLYIVGSFLERAESRPTGESIEALLFARKLGTVSSLVEIAGALLAIKVVRALDARLAERHRRLHHASDEELDAIDLD